MVIHISRKPKIQRTLTTQDKSISLALKRLWLSQKADLNLTQGKICAQLGITQSAFSQFINGQAAIPKYQLLKTAKILHVDPSDIDATITKDIQYTQSASPVQNTRTPIMFTLSNTKPKEQFVETLKTKNSRVGYAVEINNNHYAPLLPEGSLIIIDPHTHFLAGDKIFMRLTTGEHIFAIFDKLKDARYFLTAISPQDTINQLGYKDADVTSIHFVSGFETPIAS